MDTNTSPTRVQIIAPAGRAFAPNFPGWGAFDLKGDAAAQGLVDIPVGATATVVGTESHGSYPYTRLVLEIDGVGRANGVDPAAVEAL